jgi:hypothetical protein
VKPKRIKQSIVLPLMLLTLAVKAMLPGHSLGTPISESGTDKGSTATASSIVANSNSAVIAPPQPPTPQTTPRSVASPNPLDPSIVIHSYHALGTIERAATAPWYNQVIQTPSVTATNTGTGPIVAVIDTGMALNHVGLSSHWYTNPGEVGATTQEGGAPNCTSRGLALDKSCNHLDNDGDGYTSNWRGWDFIQNDNDPQTGVTTPSSTSAFHGSFVAGIIGATTSNGVGGLAPNARIMPLQALDDSGNGTTLTVAAAVRYAADHGAQVINISLGSSDDDTYLNAQIDYAIAKGIVVVAAAGNDGCDCMIYPANHAHVIAVGSSDQQDARSSFSSYGANLGMMAPGSSICSTYWTAATPNTSYACGGSGTSFASPMVAGAIALMMDSGTPTAINAAQAVMVSADKVNGMAGSLRTSQYGIGRLNVTEALKAAGSLHYHLTDAPTFKLHCAGDNEYCSYGIVDQLGSVSMLTAKSPLSVGGDNLYFSPSSSTTNPSVISMQPITSLPNAQRTYLTLDP